LIDEGVCSETGGFNQWPESQHERGEFIRNYPGPKDAHSGWESRGQKVAAQGTRDVNPEDVIPMEEVDFRDF